MRDFILLNENGEKVSLMNDTFFFYTPDGLGFDHSNNYTDNDGFFALVQAGTMQTPKSGYMVFKPGNPYGAYKEFADFILKANQLTLGYKPQTEWYYQDVDCVSLDKGELTQFGTLECRIEFLPVSPMRTELNLALSIATTDHGNAKRYTYSYPYKYSESTSGKVSISSIDAQMPCDWGFELYGALGSPVMEVETEGKTIARIDMSAIQIASGEKLVFSTVSGKAGATLNGVDVTNMIELNAGIPIFGKLPADTPIDFTLTMQTASADRDSTIKIYRYFRSI